MNHLKQLCILSLISICLLLGACGIKLEETHAQAHMDNIYKARKLGSFHREFKYYAKDEFVIVPFPEVESTLRSILGGAGQFKSATLLHAKVSRRNQLGKGLVNYLVLTYKVKYSNMELEESYYFQGESEEPKLVYMTLALP